MQIANSRVDNIIMWGGSREYGEGIQLVNVLRNQEYDKGNRE